MDLQVSQTGEPNNVFINNPWRGPLFELVEPDTMRIELLKRVGAGILRDLSETEGGDLIMTEINVFVVARRAV